MSPDDYRQAFGDGRASRQRELTIVQDVASDHAVQASSPPVPVTLVTRGSDLYSAFAGFGGGELAPLTERTALMIPAIYACVNVIAGALSSLPMHLFARQADGERSRLHNDPLWWILNEEFCPRWLAAAGWEYLALSRLFHGDAFAEIQRRGSTITGLVPLHPFRVQVAPWADGTRLAYAITPDPWATDTTMRVLDQDDVLHVPGLGFDGCRSVSPLRWALRQAGAVARETQSYSAQFFKNMARPDYVMVAPAGSALSPEQQESLRSQIDERHGHAQGMSGRPMLLQGGLDVKTLALSNKDAELVAARGLQIEEIASIFGVPPFMIGHNEKTTSWGSGVGEMGTGFVRYTLRRHLIAFQNEINRKFFRTAAKVAEFDTFELEAADMTKLFDAFRNALGRAGEDGFMTVDEVRAKLNLNRSPGGDVLKKGMPDAQPATV